MILQIEIESVDWNGDMINIEAKKEAIVKYLYSILRPDKIKPIKVVCKETEPEYYYIIKGKIERV